MGYRESMREGNRQLGQFPCAPGAVKFFSANIPSSLLFLPFPLHVHCSQPVLEVCRCQSLLTDARLSCLPACIKEKGRDVEQGKKSTRGGSQLRHFTWF